MQVLLLPTFMPSVMLKIYTMTASFLLGLMELRVHILPMEPIAA